MAQRVIFTPKPGETANSTSSVAINTASFGISGSLLPELQVGFDYITGIGETPYVSVYTYIGGVKHYYLSSQLDCYVEADLFPEDVQDRLLALYDRDAEIKNLVVGTDSKLDTVITYLQVSLMAQVLNLAATLVTMTNTLNGQTELIDRIHKNTKGVSKGGSVL